MKVLLVLYLLPFLACAELLDKQNDKNSNSEGPSEQGEENTATDTATNTAIDDGTPPSIAEAVRTVAEDSAECKALGDFYYEIGDVNSSIVSGKIGENFESTSSVAIASATKWLFGAYVAQVRAGVLLQADIQALRMGTGAVSFNNCLLFHTVASCFSAVINGNGAIDPAKVGRFNYGGGHFQKWGSTDGVISTLSTENLTTQFSSVLSNDLFAPDLMKFQITQLAGGILSSAALYGKFLRKILAEELHIFSLLGTESVCTLPATCSSADYSPVPLAWSYSIGHWIENGPTGDSAFSSPGLFGFYPWIDASKTYYGIISRKDETNAYSPLPDSSYWQSVLCGQSIRKKFMSVISGT